MIGEGVVVKSGQKKVVQVTLGDSKDGPHHCGTTSS